MLPQHKERDIVGTRVAIQFDAILYLLCCEPFPPSDHRRRKAAVPDICGGLGAEEEFGSH